MRNIFKFLTSINIKTIYFNLKYLPIHQAIKLPILLSRRVYLREVAGKINISCPVYHAMVQIGFGDIGIFDKRMSRSIWNVSGNVVFNGSANLGHGTKISVDKGGTLTLGENFAIAAESAIVVSEDIRFGDNCLLSWDVLIMDSDHHKIIGEDGDVINPTTPVVIGDKVWIGCRCSILKGSKIPDNSVVGANTVVTRELTENNGLYAGLPAKFIKGNIDWAI